MNTTEDVQAIGHDRPKGSVEVREECSRVCDRSCRLEAVRERTFATMAQFGLRL